MVPISEQKWFWGPRGEVIGRLREETYMYTGKGLEVMKLILQLLERAR